MLLTSGWAFGQDAGNQPNQPNKPEYVLKVYRVSDLFTPRPDYPYRGGLPATGSANQSSTATGGTTIIGGGGGSMGGGMGGGGFFQVPDPIRVAQFAGEGGGLGGGGFAGDMADMGGMVRPGANEALRFGRDELVDAIIGTVMPDTWLDTAGGEGVCTPLGGMLLIKQTAEAHKQIEQLLSDIRTEGGNLHTVTLDAAWLSLTSDEFEKLVPKPNGEEGELPAVDSAVLKELAAKNTTHQGRVSCYNDQTVHLVSGDRRTLVVGVSPTVGFGSVGYTPAMAIPNIGLLLQVRPTVDPNRKSAVLNVTSTLTEWQDPGEAITIKTDFEPASKDGIPTKGGSTQVSVDRVNLKTQQLATTVRVPVGQPVVVGGLSQLKNDPKAAADGPARQLYLIVKLTVNEAAR